MDQLEEFLVNVLGVTDAQLLQVGKEVCYFLDVPKGGFYFRPEDGVMPPAFLVKGLLRFYTLDEDGTEVTDCFVTQAGMPVVNSTDLATSLEVWAQALEDSCVLVFPMGEAMKLLSNNVNAMHIFMQLQGKANLVHRNAKLALGQYGAKERYEWFLQEYDGLIDRVPHGYIASFLGVNPVTLSRIRGQMKEA